LVASLDDEDFSEMVLEAQRLSGLSQGRFAELLGVTPATLSRWTNGRMAIPAWASRAALGAALLAGVSIQLPNPAKNLYRE
jgi:transcriptional regulator with XRE-family HTH domain